MDRTFSYGSTLRFSCNNGYLIDGQSTITCQSDDSWSSLPPTCSPVECGDPGEVSMGTKTLLNATYTFGSQVHYTCYDGYEIINGVDTISCQANGVWTNPVPTCSIISCGEPDSPVNGHYSGSSFTFGSEIEFLCNAGYTLIGSAVSVCTQNKEWSGLTPTCTKLQCPEIGPTSFLVIDPVKAAYVVGDVVSAFVSVWL